jgi:hypothetical protein
MSWRAKQDHRGRYHFATKFPEVDLARLCYTLALARLRFLLDLLQTPSVRGLVCIVFVCFKMRNRHLDVNGDSAMGNLLGIYISLLPYRRCARVGFPIYLSRHGFGGEGNESCSSGTALRERSPKILRRHRACRLLPNRGACRSGPRRNALRERRLRHLCSLNIALPARTAPQWRPSHLGLRRTPLTGYYWLMSFLCPCEQLHGHRRLEHGRA